MYEHVEFVNEKPDFLPIGRRSKTSGLWAQQALEELERHPNKVGYLRTKTIRLAKTRQQSLRYYNKNGVKLAGIHTAVRKARDGDGWKLWFWLEEAEDA
ncbi:MAG: hypothetical protein V3V32_04605 [Dehalococcoidia bacterium]